MKTLKQSWQLILTIGLALFFLLQNARAAPEKSVIFAPQKGTVKFLALGRPQALRIRGTGTGPQGRLAISAGAKPTDPSLLDGEIHFDMSSLQTGIELRDEHMKEKYLETKKYSDATLTVHGLSISSSVRDGNGTMNDAPFNGKLKLHGVEKEVSGHFTANATTGKVQVHAEFAVHLDDFAIAIPKYLGITVADEVSIEIDSSGEWQ